MNKYPLTQQEIELIIKDPKIRKELAYKNPYLFFHIYLAGYVKYPTAKFQEEIFELTEQEDPMLYEVIAFRGSAKSTIIAHSLPIWSFLGFHQKKYILLLSQTQQQARQSLINIKRELETNTLLIDDFGPFVEDSDEWRTSSLVIPKFGVRISAASVGESIRGLIHGENRPDLIIADDVEDLTSVRTKEGRDKTFEWFTSEVIPGGDLKTKIFLIGNLLHEDSLMMRIKERIENGKTKGIVKQYPLFDSDNNNLWPGKFPDLNSIETLKLSVPSEAAWFREFLLRIVSDADRIIYSEWVQYYDFIPQTRGKEYKMTAVGVDLAISEKTTADFTAIITAQLFVIGDLPKIYILPNVLNKRLNFAEASDTVASVADTLGCGSDIKIYVESIGYQEALAQNLRSKGYSVESVNPKGDKSVRLSGLAPLIKNGTISFPNKGAELLINQIINFGVEKHDDLADALVYAVEPLITYAHRKKSRAFSHKPEGW